MNIRPAVLIGSTIKSGAEITGARRNEIHLARVRLGGRDLGQSRESEFLARLCRTHLELELSLVSSWIAFSCEARGVRVY